MSVHQLQQDEQDVARYVVGNIDNGRGYARVWAGDLWHISILSPINVSMKIIMNVCREIMVFLKHNCKFSDTPPSQTWSVCPFFSNLDKTL